MKKSKIALVVFLAVVLVLTCISFPTFSWYSRSNELKSETLEWSPSQKAYTGKNINLSTFYSADGKTYDSDPIDDLDYVIAANSRAYFRTDITNNTSAEQNVSLFLSALKMLGSSGAKQLYIGTNGPLRTHKLFEIDASLAARENVSTASNVKKRNLYVGFSTAKSYNATDFKVHFWNNSGIKGDSYVGGMPIGSTRTFHTDFGNDVVAQLYTATINYDADQAQLQYKDGYVHVNASSEKDDIYIVNRRSDNDLLLNVLLWHEYSGVNHVSFLAATDANHTTGDHGAAINTYYSSAEVEQDTTLSLPATGTGTMTYSSSDTSIATVNASGVVSGIGEGRATITATSTGIYGDTVTATCDVEVFPSADKYFYDIPLTTNYIVNAAQGNISSTSSVYWYIQNESDSTLEYDIGGLYLGL